MRSSGTDPVAAACSSRYASRFLTARSSKPARSRSRFCAVAESELLSSRTILPSARPSSAGRLGASAFQNAILPGSPGAGVTSTWDGVISAIRHVDAPSTNVSPTRLSYTISSSSSPTRRPSSRRFTVYRPRSGIVPGLVTASFCAPARPRTVAAMRSHTIRGLSSMNSSDG